MTRLLDMIREMAMIVARLEKRSAKVESSVATSEQEHAAFPHFHNATSSWSI